MMNETSKLMDIRGTKNKEKVISKLKDYSELLEVASESSNIDKSTLEWIISQFKDDDEVGDNDELLLDFSENDTFSVNRFVNNGVEEFLAFAVETPTSLLEDLFDVIYPLYKELNEYQFVYANTDNNIRDKVGFIYRVEEELSLKLKKSLTILRMKGLGESDAEDLEATTINPSNRKLTQITLDNVDDIDGLLNDFMGNNIEFRKEFLIDAVRKADLENLAD